MRSFPPRAIPDYGEGVRLTLHADYGLRILIYLATCPDTVVTTTAIGRAYGISKNHLVRVAHSLRDGGFIALTTGRSGGLTLTRATTDIRIGEVVRALEPDLRIVECFDLSTNTCPIAPRCALTAVLGDALSAFLATLDRVTLDDIVQRSGPKLTSHFIVGSALTRLVTRPRARAATSRASRATTGR
jgi:Rrf2 family transcriptional regulator, nitric oxide-sensitive transcriptional repressor